MITIYGMNTNIGNVSFNDPTGEYGYQRPYSEKTAQLIDEEARSMIEEAYRRTIALLTDKRTEVEAVAKELLEKEIIFKSDLERLIGKRPYEESDAVQEVANSQLEHQANSNNSSTNLTISSHEAEVTETPTSVEETSSKDISTQPTDNPVVTDETSTAEDNSTKS
jgi:cell division protease FtsH